MPLVPAASRLLLVRLMPRHAHTYNESDYAYTEGDEASDGYHASATGIGVWPPTVAERNAAG